MVTVMSYMKPKENSFQSIRGSEFGESASQLALYKHSIVIFIPVSFVDRKTGTLLEPINRPAFFLKTKEKESSHGGIV